MTTDRETAYLVGLVHELCKLPRETEWVEFKVNNGDPQQIGEYLSALANAAALNGKANAYVVWGVDDQTHRVVGTTFSAAAAKKGNEPLETWLLRLLTPKLHFRFQEFKMERQDRIRACYLHACLRYVMRQPVTNTSLRTRFGIEEKNAAVASRLLNEAVEDGVIVVRDPRVGTRSRSYLPYWAAPSPVTPGEVA